MAFTVPPSRASGTTGAGSNTTSHTIWINAIGTISSGDLLVAVISMDGGRSADDAGWPAGWSEFLALANGSTTAGVSLNAAYRIADETEGSSFTYTTVAIERGTYVVFRIPASEWDGTTPPEASTGVTGTGTSANPDSLAPSWGSATSLWVAAVAVDTGTGATITNPSQGSFSGLTTAEEGSSGGSSIGVSFREDTLSSIDPAAFTIASSQDYAVATLAIRPLTTATGAVSGQAPTVAGTGTVSIPGTGAVTSAAPTVAGTGSLTLTATGAIAGRAPTVAATGSETFTATGAMTAPSGTVSGTGVETFTASGAVSGQAPTTSGTGVESMTATGTVSAPSGTVAGTGTETLTATGAIAASAPTVAGTGTGNDELTATGAIAGQPPTAAGTGTLSIPSTGAVAVTAPTMDGTGLVILTGSGAASVPSATVVGTGTAVAVATTGTGAIAAAAGTVAGTGAMVQPVGGPFPRLSGGRVSPPPGGSTLTLPSGASGPALPSGASRLAPPSGTAHRPR